jgi:hypothetical protein
MCLDQLGQGEKKAESKVIAKPRVVVQAYNPS